LSTPASEENLGVRVRGIYCTAITQLLLSKGIPVADPTEPILERFPELSPARAAAVTVKDREDKHGLVVLGSDPLFTEVVEALREAAEWVIVRESKLGYFSSYKCRVIRRTAGGYEVELPEGVKGLLRAGGGLAEGSLVEAHVVAPLASPPLLDPGLAVVGTYARLIKGGKFSFSRFIRDAEKLADLLSLASKMVREGWGVRWRSSASKASLEELMSELDRLNKEAEELEKRSERATGPAKLSEGERIAVVVLPLQAKVKMDAVRRSKVRTLALHHHLKTLGPEVSRIVDLLESDFSCCSEDCLGASVCKDFLRRLRERGFKRIVILHEKPDGRVIELRGDVESFGKVIVVKRQIQGKGLYDGLNVERTPGDIAITVLAPFSPILIHSYFSREGVLKGHFVNVNTPIELSSHGMSLTARYVDLEVDVVVSGEEVRRIDEDKLDKLVSSGVVSEQLAKWALETAEYVEREAKLLASAEGREALIEGALRTLVQSWLPSNF